MINKVLIIGDNITLDHLNTITDYFLKYEIGKPKTITYNEDKFTALLELEEWCDNVCARNVYERICEKGLTKIIYNDPDYFIVKFYEEEGTPDYRDEYIVKENSVENYEYEVDYRDEYIKKENSVNSYTENGYSNHNLDFKLESNKVDDVTSKYSDESEDYLEDDVIENANNIDMLFEHVKEMTNKISSIERILGNISKKTTILYKNRPRIVKKSVWVNRLRSRSRLK
tara:strand:+ start:2579 stop:3262 length:684 start_codon:yes stop_codon:yes gene_type:complete